MSKTVSDFLCERLSQWGIRTIFGYPGDGINGLLGRFQREPRSWPSPCRLYRGDETALGTFTANTLFQFVHGERGR